MIRYFFRKMTSLQHCDFGSNGSEFIYHHKPLKSRISFTVFLAALLTLAFSFELHLKDKNVLTALCLVVTCSLIIKLYLKVYSESILILPSLGIQVTKSFYLGRVNTSFIHSSLIKDIVINEAMTMHSVIYYLVVLLKGKHSGSLEKLYPLFSHSWPQLEELLQVYRTAQEKLILIRPISKIEKSNSSIDSL